MHRILFLSAVLALAACDGAEPPSVGSFEGAVTGDLDRALRGDATLSSFDGFGGGRLLTVNLMDRAGDARLRRFVTLSDYGGQIDGEGTYAIDASRLDGVSLVYFDEGGAVGATWTATGGSVRVTRYEDDRIEGEVTADLADAGIATGSATRTASLRATFEAVRLSGVEPR